MSDKPPMSPDWITSTRPLDGSEVLHWPEFIALAKALGINCEGASAVDLVMESPESMFAVVVNAGPVEQLPCTCFVVYKLPEFRALCARLNVAYGMPTEDLIVNIRSGQVVTATHGYSCRCSDPGRQTLAKVETWRDRQPLL